MQVHMCTHTYTHLLVCIFTKGIIFLQFLDFGITLHFLQLQFLSCCFLLLQLLFQVLNTNTELANPRIPTKLTEMPVRNHYCHKFNTMRAQQAWILKTCTSDRNQYKLRMKLRNWCKDSPISIHLKIPHIVSTVRTLLKCNRPPSNQTNHSNPTHLYTNYSRLSTRYKLKVHSPAAYINHVIPISVTD